MNQLAFDFIPEEPSLLDSLQNTINVLQKFRVDIEKALCYGGLTHSFDDVSRGVLSGDFFLHYTPNSVVLGEVSNFPRKKLYNIFIVAGNMEEALSLHPKVERFATSLGCETLTMTGRFGWERVLTKHGWEPMLILMKKDM